MLIPGRSKRSQMRGARKTGERRRTGEVRWSETVERNEADGPFSTACMKRGHRPQRTCLGCGKREDQEALLRLVVRGDAELHVDRRGRGRGGYLHKAARCWEAFSRKKSLYRAFRLEIGRESREKLILTLRD